MQLPLILTVIVLGFTLTLFLIRRWLTETRSHDSLLSDWLKTSTTQLNQRLDSAAALMAGVQKNLGEMSEVGRGIKSLQEFLQSPKLRGGLGEQVLQEMIGQTLPKNAFHFQYSFRSGVKVDAAIKTDAGILCIDSKFPLENFQAIYQSDSDVARDAARKAFISDVRHHIDDIAKKYILPDEGTLDFALMYIPSEAVYYEAVNLPEISEHARKLRIYPVSPNTFYAHLQVLLLSYQGKELQSQTKQVFQLLRALQKDYGKVEENMGVLNRHLTNAFNQMSHVSSSFNLLGQKLSQTQTLSPSEETKELHA